MQITILIKAQSAVGELPVAYPVTESLINTHDLGVFISNTAKLALHEHRGDDISLIITGRESLAALAGFSTIAILPVPRFEALSPCELPVAKLWARGLTARQIKDEIHLAFDTVRNHVKSIYAKLGVNSKAAFVLTFPLYNIWDAAQVKKRA